MPFVFASPHICIYQLYQKPGGVEYMYYLVLQCHRRSVLKRLKLEERIEMYACSVFHRHSHSFLNIISCVKAEKVQ